MGVVYKARQISLNRLVALKTIRGDRLASEADLQRFHFEAEAVANLDHSHIVPIYEVGEHRGHHYFSMKLLAGGSLEKRLADYLDEPRNAARLLVTVAQAMHHAHQRGILHRDLKPANILLDADGGPHVADFGLAKRVEGQDDLTLSGAIVGTPSYMAPEQASGKKAGGDDGDRRLRPGGGPLRAAGGPVRRSWAIPCIQTLDLVRDHEPEPPSKVNRRVRARPGGHLPEVPGEGPARRYGSAAALADDLARFLANEPILAKPVGRLEKLWLWSRRNPVVAGLAAAMMSILVVVAVGSTLAAFQFEHLAEEQRRAAEETRRLLIRQYVAAGTRLMDEGDLLRSLPWLTEALRLDQGNPAREREHRIRLGAVLRAALNLCTSIATMGPSSPRTPAPTAGASSPQAMTARRESGMRPPGLPCSRSRHAGVVRYADFSPDGRRIVTASEDKTARVWDAETGTLIKVTRGAHRQGASRRLQPRRSPRRHRQPGRHGAGLGRGRPASRPIGSSTAIGSGTPPSAPTVAASSPPARTARRGSGTPPPARRSATPSGITARCGMRPSAPTAGASSPRARTVRRRSGMRRPARERARA